MSIIFSLPRLIIISIAVLVIGGGVGYWGATFIDRDDVPQPQEQSASQNPIVPDTDTEIDYSGEGNLTQVDEEVEFIRGDIKWNNPQDYPSFGMITPSSSEATVQYKKVGVIKKEGIFNGDDLVIVTSDYGMDSEIYSVILHQGKNYIVASRSSDPVSNNIDEKNTVIARLITIKELDVPEILYGPKPRQTLRRYSPWGLTWFDEQEKIFAFNHPDYGSVYENAAHGFSIKLPDSREVVYELVIDFVDEKNVPQVTWSNGERNKSDYTFTDIGGCGNTNVASVMSSNDIDTAKDLKEAGKNNQGDVVWELKDTNHLILKKIYDEQYFVVDYEGTGAQKIPYDAFVKQHPVFFWKDAFGRMIKFQKREFLPVAECAKPVIYLYPETTTDVSIEIDPQGGFLYTEPEYGDGWRVLAQPDGTLTELSSGVQYPYLFWEGRGGLYQTPNKGWVVRQSEVESLIREKLSYIGLNNKEQQDFLDYWLLYMKDAPYYFVTFMQNSVMDAIAPLSVSPQPDSVIRVLMDFKPLDGPADIVAPVLRHRERNGFTVVEWGGVKHAYY